MSDIRDLRLAIETKLKERRELLTSNASLRSNLDRSRQEVGFLKDVLNSPLLNYAMEECADAIVNQILSEAISASHAVAEQTIENGDYVVGINIPSLHIRHVISRGLVDLDKDVKSSSFTHINVGSLHGRY